MYVVSFVQAAVNVIAAPIKYLYIRANSAFHPSKVGK